MGEAGGVLEVGGIWGNVGGGAMDTEHLLPKSYNDMRIRLINIKSINANNEALGTTNTRIRVLSIRVFDQGFRIRVARKARVQEGKKSGLRLRTTCNACFRLLGLGSGSVLGLQ
jgi:hypothetical protein